MCKQFIITTVFTGLVLPLRTAAQPFGDHNFDGAIDQADVTGMAACITAPGVPPGPGCWKHDFDLDVDVDLDDIRRFQLDFGAVSGGLTRLMGRWSGSGMTADDTGNEPFDLLIAQRDHKIMAIAWYTVTGDPLFGWPAVRLVGSINGNDLLLGASGRLDNACQGTPFLQTDNAVVTASFNPTNGRLMLTGIVDYLPVGCDQILQTFVAARDDASYQPGNDDILGTWEGEVVTPPGWLFAPIPIYHPRKSFFLNPSLIGYLEFTANGNWGELFLQWDPQANTAIYTWLCLQSFRYTGSIDGNKFSGFLKWTNSPDEDFFGVFCHDLQPSLVFPDTIVQCQSLPAPDNERVAPKESIGVAPEAKISVAPANSRCEQAPGREPHE